MKKKNRPKKPDAENKCLRLLENARACCLEAARARLAAETAYNSAETVYLDALNAIPTDVQTELARLIAWHKKWGLDAAPSRLVKLLKKKA